LLVKGRFSEDRNRLAPRVEATQPDASVGTMPHITQDPGFENVVDGGFVCKLCDPAPRRKFSSYDELVADHCFEPLLQWCNDNFTGEAQLRLYASASGGMHWAKVVFPASAPDPFADGCVTWWRLRA
jgi:hypothetical protein